ncbi:MAG: glutamate 5-kinase [Alphaproteobacteria bacterium]|nr:glutamate 5-kinase [Alphaproteobacteria bacterium]
MASLENINTAKRLVVKIGSALLVDAKTGALRLDWLKAFALDVAAAKSRGQDVLIVSSGSISLGRRVLELPSGALSLEQSQAAAAVGQIRLARAYETALAPHNITTAQVLVTLEDSTNRRRYLNSRATLGTLLHLGVVPIVNENDTVATDEIRFGDNDRLAAQIAVLSGADLLVLLSDVDGLYTANPKTDPDAEHIDIVAKITPELDHMAGEAINEASRGGMKTKLIAAKTATAAGCALVIMEGDVARPLDALHNGARHTLFCANGDPHTARKQWISAMKPKGDVHIDAGAARALAGGKSLLSAGVTAIVGTFSRGDPVAILGPDQEVLGKGLISYDCVEAAAIKGCHSREIERVLGYLGRAALIHRDDMAI